MLYEIIPVCVGKATDVPLSTFTWGMRDGLVDSPHIIWALRDETGSVVIVDTGSGPVEWVTEHHRAFTRTPEEEPAAALANAGIDLELVETVVLSHLHYDHCANNHLFPNATFIVHREEVAYATSPHPVHQLAYEAPALGFRPRWLDTMDRTKVIERDTTLRPGIRLIHLPGHTPGLLGTVVDTPSGRVAIASDHCGRYENWEGLGPLSVIPSRTFVNLDDYYRSFDKLAQCADSVLPSHDLRVFERLRHPGNS